MDNKWVVAGIVVGAGLLIGSILGPIVRKLLAKEKSPEALRELAPVIGSFVFWLCVSFGLIVGLGSASPGSLDPIPTKLVTYFPKVMVAGLLIIAGKVVAVWSVTIEIQDADGSHIHVPHAAALDGMLRLRSQD